MKWHSCRLAFTAEALQPSCNILAESIAITLDAGILPTWLSSLFYPDKVC